MRCGALGKWGRKNKPCLVHQLKTVNYSYNKYALSLCLAQPKSHRRWRCVPRAVYLPLLLPCSTACFRQLCLHSATTTNAPTRASLCRRCARGTPLISTHVPTTRSASRRWPALRTSWRLAPAPAPAYLWLSVCVIYAYHVPCGGGVSGRESMSRKGKNRELAARKPFFTRP